MQSQPHHTASHHQHAASHHQHNVQLNFPEGSPPTLPVRRRGVVCTLGLISLVFSFLFFFLIALETPFIKLENRLLESRMRAAPYRKDRPPVLNAVPIVIGFWDEHKTVTALQLVVCLSLALDIDETHITVLHEGAHFYRTTIENEGSWVIEAANDESGVFLTALNAQAARFGAQLVLSHAARRLTADEEPPPNAASSSSTP